MDLKAAFPQLAAANLPTLGLMLIMALNTVIIGPFLGLIIAFDEEYGWRGYLHALNNQALSFFMMTMVMPTSMLFSFGMGVPSLVLGAIVVLLILRDPVWKVTEPSRE